MNFITDGSILQNLVSSNRYILEKPEIHVENVLKRIKIKNVGRFFVICCYVKYIVSISPKSKWSIIRVFMKQVAIKLCCNVTCRMLYFMQSYYLLLMYI